MDTKTSGEIAAGPVDGTELVRIVQTGSNRKTTVQSIADLARTTTTIYSSNTPTLNLPATNGLLTIVRQGTPAPLLVHLPTLPSLNLTLELKDGGNNFGTNNATVKTTDGTQIDGVAGSTGFVMNQNRQANKFTWDGVMWNILSVVGIALLMALVSPAFAFERPHACSENETQITCMLMVQRNNALDELALAEAGRRGALDRIDELSDWIKRYDDGVAMKEKWYRQYLDGLSKPSQPEDDIP